MNEMSYVEISTREEALKAWDEEGVILRRSLDSRGEEVVYLYPRIPRGFVYPNFNLRSEASLQAFRSSEQAMRWARVRGYEVTEVN